MDDRILETTVSICPSCLKSVPASIRTDGSIVYMEKKCEEHGLSKGIVWNSLKRYLWSFRFTKRRIAPVAHYGSAEVHGCPLDCGLCPRHEQHTCLAILEVTESCDLACPVCLMSANRGGSQGPSREKIEHALDSLIKHEGRPTPLQLSGGEPTIRSDLTEIIASARRKGFSFVEVDTNGIRIANNLELARDYADAGLSGIYLQFDGITDEVYETIRGDQLLQVKEKAINNARRAGLHVVLAVTAIKGVNDHQLWHIVDYALKKRLNGVNFQPLSVFGRIPPSLASPMNKITTSDVPDLLSVQSDGRLRSDDFIPVPCPDNRCQMVSYLRVDDRSAKPVSRLVDVDSLSDYYGRFTDVALMNDAMSKLRRTVQGARKSSAVANESAEISLKQESQEHLPCCGVASAEHDDRFFAVSIHGMMDAWNSDVHRQQKCCIHELTLEGKLIPFCLYNMTSVTGTALYRQSDLFTKLGSAPREHNRCFGEVHPDSH